MEKVLIYNDVYQQNFILIISDDIDAISKTYEVPFNGEGLTLARGTIIYIFLGTGSSISDLVHEAHHAISFMWEDRGIELIEGKDEPFAYAMGWIVKKIYPVWRRSKKFPVQGT